MANCTQCGRKLPPFSFKKICQWCVQHEAAKRGESDDDARQPVMAVPWVRRGESTISLTKLLFGANVAVFIAMAYASGSIENFPGEILGHFGANFGPYTLAGDWWRLVTYMFLHLDLWHIAFNMWCLWDLGALCESLYGTWTFGAVYLITGVAGGLARLAWDPMVPSVGASGAIFGLAGALIASLYLGEFSIPRYAIQANLRSLLFFVGFNVLFGISPIGDLIGVHVDNACHIGGLVSGLILGALIARLAPQENELVRRTTVIAVVAIALLGAGFGVRQWRGSEMHFVRSAVNGGKNIDQIISDLQKKIQKNPQDATAHYDLARAFFAKGQVRHGMAELKRVLELEPQNANALLDLGAVYLSQGQDKEAQEEFSKLVAQAPDNVGAHIGLGMALADQQDHAGAIAEYKTALRLNPQADGVHYQMGISQAKLRQYDDAIASYRKERENNGDDAKLEIALADAYQAKGLLQEAEDARTKATQLKNSQQQ